MDMTQVIGILPPERPGLAYFTVNIMGGDGLATQGARASATIMLT